MNFLCFGVTGVLSPFIARMLDAGPGRTETLPGFQHGLATLAFGVAVALILTFFLRETGQAGARQQKHDPVGSGRPGLSPIYPGTLEPAAPGAD